MYATLSSAVALMAAIAVSPIGVLGQDIAAPPGLGLGVSAGLISFSDDIDNYNLGTAVEGAVRYTSAGGIQVLGGGQYGQVDVQNLNKSRTVWGVFADARLLLQKDGRSAAPYIGARVAYLDQSLDTDVFGEISSTGWLAAAMFGVLVRLASQVSLDATAIFGVAQFGDQEIDGVPQPDSGNSGATFSAKLGLVYSLSR